MQGALAVQCGRAGAGGGGGGIAYVVGKRPLLTGPRDALFAAKNKQESTKCPDLLVKN
jgi:hypothetical protein